MGTNFGEPNQINPVGFYEDLSVAAVNDKIYTDCGLLDRNDLPRRAVRKARRVLGLPPLSNPLLIPPRSAVMASGARYALEMRDLVALLCPTPGAGRARTWR
jgi:hypothetical protein